jgi:glycosyltransferase involved in cell wall biosynthesis
VEEAGAGLVVAADVAGFHDGLISILRRPGLRTRMRDNALALARRYSWDAIVDRLIGIYAESLTRSTERRRA